MARDDYGAISVISDEEREALGIGGRRPDEEEEGLFETIGKAGDKIGETKFGNEWAVNISRAGDYLLTNWLTVTIPESKLVYTSPSPSFKQFLQWTPNFMHNLSLKM